ncbi:unnamed protein product [Kuraishia capsulata CBS 1993]|uniref:NAD-dependent epimerase/dehydratase domain-containing protein n=1 Tax=Kuraishia capsulata CBS 1993 TaxID=1382522 RepID=W6MJU3_9ASCO|nr:uncharacterized protein KUCA_T00000769001 [Kuraishia capsulata CBS 1993]CDK24802.1 unnamed protein product [Kuraishia capsulata CBS 1993]
MTTAVLVTGASGFIALHIVDQLLSQGYSVVGTVRTKEKGDYVYSQFSAKYKNPKLTLEYVKDIAELDAFDNAVKNHPEVEFVLHTASPVHSTTDGTPEELFINPAVNGTVGILKAVEKYAPQVKHVVMTSSFATVRNADKAGDKSFKHTEETWNPITRADLNGDVMPSYSLSKTLAEKAARELVASTSANFTFHTVNPPFVYGPQLFEASIANPELNFSAEKVKSVLHLPADSKGPFDNPQVLTIDVRDVARAHIAALSDPAKFANKRLLPTVGRSNPQRVLDTIRLKFPELREKLPVGDPARGEKEREAKGFYYDNSKTRELLGFEFIPYETTIYDSVKQILDYEEAQV